MESPHNQFPKEVVKGNLKTLRVNTVLNFSKID